MTRLLFVLLFLISTGLGVLEAAASAPQVAYADGALD